MQVPPPELQTTQVPPPPPDAVAAPDKLADPSTHFIFTHKVFLIENCRFALNGSDKLPCFYVPLGEQVAAIELRKLQSEFGIPASSPDAVLLKQVERGLKYVRDIRPNDSIPREILDGSASWSVEERHKQLAKTKLNMELIFWFTGLRADLPPLEEMLRLQKEPEGRGQIRDAQVKLAQLLGLKDPRVIPEKLEAITRETPYIEALRERSNRLGDISQKLSAFITAFRKDNAFVAEIVRMQDLMRRASRIINDKFARTDLWLKDVARAVGDVKGTIAVVRETRDDIHLELKKWDEHFDIWAEMPIEHSESNDKYFRRFYQFLAEHYMEKQDWNSTGIRKK